MKYLHKFAGDEDATIYVVTSSQQRPGNMSIRQKSWEGRAMGGQASTILKQIAGLSFNKEIKEPKVLPEETPELKKKKASLVEELDKIACELQTQGSDQIAYAIDQVSDFLDPTKD